MSEAEGLFAILRQSADADAVAAIERLVREGADRELCRINALAFAARTGLDEERVIGGLPARRAPRASSSCPGTCSAPAAAACSRPAPR